ncbi:MAG TPA: DUF2569 family protein [Candidatus Acidoferrales bacterium]|nr:DUF2569 family protein [Candidatus Acidoferrales bacterium]
MSELRLDQTTTWQPEYKSVGGWLLFLALALGLFSPFQTLKNVSQTWLQGQNPLTYKHPLREVVVANSAVAVAVTFLEIYAAICLIHLKRTAVRTTKLVLTILFFEAFAELLAFAMVSNLKIWDPDNLSASLAVQFARKMVFLGVWSWYLAKSERVAGTYPPSESALFK